MGLLEENGFGRSSGGRAPREDRLRADAGVILVAPLGFTGGSAGVTDFAGRLVDTRVIEFDIASGPEVVLDNARCSTICSTLPCWPDALVYGVGVGVRGPVEFASGRPVSPPIMPGRDGTTPEASRPTAGRPESAAASLS
jgi:hypothetical protein